MDLQPHHLETLGDSSLKHFQTLEGDASFEDCDLMHASAPFLGLYPDDSVAAAWSR